MSKMNIDDKTKAALTEAENAVKAVWEIDGVTVYVRDLKIDNGNVVVDWFTFDENVDKTTLGVKVEDLARKQIGVDYIKPSIMRKLWNFIGRI